MEYKDPGRYIPIIYLLYSWGSLFGVPIRVPLYNLKVLKRYNLNTLKFGYCPSPATINFRGPVKITYNYVLYNKLYPTVTKWGGSNLKAHPHPQ